jgi:hypothetical protein
VAVIGTEFDLRKEIELGGADGLSSPWLLRPVFSAGEKQVKAVDGQRQPHGDAQDSPHLKREKRGTPLFYHRPEVKAGQGDTEESSGAQPPPGSKFWQSPSLYRFQTRVAHR